MPVRTVDARGKACPQPVIETRRVLEDGGVGVVAVLVDNQSAAENVARMGRSQGCEVRLEDEGAGEFRVVLTRGADAPARQPQIIRSIAKDAPKAIGIFLKRK